MKNTSISFHINKIPKVCHAGNMTGKFPKTPPKLTTEIKVHKGMPNLPQRLE